MSQLLDVNKFHRLYRRTEKRTDVTALTYTIKLNPVGPRKIRVLSHVTVENQTTALTICRLGIDNGGVIHYLDETLVVAIRELLVSRSDILLGEGDRLFAELTGQITNATLILTCIGWEQDL